MDYNINSIMAGQIISIDNVDIHLNAEVYFNDYHESIVKIFELKETILDPLDVYTGHHIVFKINNGNFINIFDACIRKYSKNILWGNTDTLDFIELLSTDAIMGPVPIISDSFQNFCIEVTDGVELIGLCPYDMNDNYVDIAMLKRFELPFEFKKLSAETNRGKFEFSVYPTTQFERDKVIFGFKHSIYFESPNIVTIRSFKEIIHSFAAFLEILCGEIVTINKVTVLTKAEEDEIISSEFIGFCNYPKERLNCLKRTNIDVTKYLRLSVFKISDFKDISKTLNLWFDLCSALSMANKAYNRILLEEDAKLFSPNKFLVAMQLVEGYSALTNNEKENLKNFKAKKKKIISKEEEPDTAQFIKQYCQYMGEPFRNALTTFTFNGLQLLQDIDYEQFELKYGEFIKKIKNERDIYTHSSQREIPFFDTATLSNISYIYKNIFRILVLNRLGMEGELICFRYSHEREFKYNMDKYFSIRLLNNNDIFRFDKDMWHFS